MSKCQIGGNCKTDCKKQENERFKNREEHEAATNPPKTTLSKITGFFKKHINRLTRKRDEAYDTCIKTACGTSHHSHETNHTNPIKTQGGRRGKRKNKSKRFRRYSRRR
jgi:hypothetical protein